MSNDVLKKPFKKLTLEEYERTNGRYHWIDGKWQRVSKETSPLKEIIPWKECNAGYFDEELGCRIESKDHYRREMKKQGLVPKESFNYCRKKKEPEFDEEKSREIFEKSYRQAVAKYGAPDGSS